MRVYLPAVLTELTDPTGLTARRARAVTPALRTALGPDADEEMAEYAALILAAEDSVDWLGDADPARRLVVAADLPEDEVGSDDGDLARVHAGEVPWSWVVSFHVDEADDGVRGLVTQARQGEGTARADVADVDLLWYDASERSGLAAES